jgi:hypothetical protein
VKYPLKDCNLTAADEGRYRQHQPRTPGNVVKCFWFNCHCGCVKTAAECQFSHTDYKITGGIDLSIVMHGVKWGGVRWDSTGNPTTAVSTAADAQALLKSLREKVARKAGKHFKESEDRATKAEAAAVKASEAAAKARAVATEKTKAADKAKPAGGEAFDKALTAQKDAQKAAAVKSQDAALAKIKAKAAAAEVGKFKAPTAGRALPSRQRGRRRATLRLRSKRRLERRSRGGSGDQGPRRRRSQLRR